MKNFPMFIQVAQMTYSFNNDWVPANSELLIYPTLKASYTGQFFACEYFLKSMYKGNWLLRLQHQSNYNERFQLLKTIPKKTARQPNI